MATLSLSYLLCVGVLEAMSLNGRLPTWLHSCVEAYSCPARVAADLPALQLPARIGIDVGYRLADGPDTTR